MLNNKKGIIIIGLAILILLTALVLALVNRQKANQPGPTNLPATELLTAEEKAYFKLDDNVKAQVLSRDASGTPTVYKLIKTDYDVVADPAAVDPISPRQGTPAE